MGHCTSKAWAKGVLDLNVGFEIRKRLCRRGIHMKTVEAQITGVPPIDFVWGYQLIFRPQLMSGHSAHERPHIKFRKSCRISAEVYTTANFEALPALGGKTWRENLWFPAVKNHFFVQNRILP